MAYMVTGGTGLIGSRIVRDLVKEGEQVVVYDLFPEGSYLQQMLSPEEMARVKIVRGDLTDLPNIMHIVQDSNVDRIVHMAALLSEASEVNPSLTLKVLAEGTINIFETARILKLKKVAWASSCTVFGPPEKYAQEYIPNDALHEPWGFYGACKSLGERFAKYYFERFGLDTTAVRFGLVYGPGRAGGASFAVTRELIEKPAIGQPGVVPYGDDTPNWLYANDAARSIVLAAKTPKTPQRAYNISSDSRSIKEVAAYVKKLLPDAKITLQPGLVGMHWKYDDSLIRKDLGFRPEWPVERAVKDMVNATRKLHGLPPV